MTEGIIVIVFFGIIRVVLLALFVYLTVLIIRALRKYLRSAPVREEKREYKKSLGEVLKGHRTSCHMTQEFVAETIGVTRQAVSKWENGTADPSTSNLLALAKLYGVSAEELLRQVEPENEEAK
jgi:DNA-binding XRE family transcriptional regulator